jgi:hypothetical protein
MIQELNHTRILEISLGFWASKTLLSAVELGLFTELAKQPMNAQTISERFDLHPRAISDFLDTLVALQFLERDGEYYFNTQETSMFLDKAKPSYIGGTLDYTNKVLYPAWGLLTKALRSGQPQCGFDDSKDFFEQIYQDPQFVQLVLSGMTGISMDIAKAVAKKFPWCNYKTFIDIGTAEGGFPVQIALVHKHLSGGGFDLPVVASSFNKYVASFGFSERLHFYPGDFFKEPLPSADVLVMGHILHDWNLEEKLMLITKAYEALPHSGALIVYDTVLDNERRQNSFGLLMSLNMLIATRGGFDYTGTECTSWMHEAGFRKVYIEHLIGSHSMVIGIK